MNLRNYIILFISLVLLVSVCYFSVNALVQDDKMPHEKVKSVESDQYKEYGELRELNLYSYHKIQDNYEIEVDSNNNVWITESLRKNDKLEVITKNSAGRVTYSEGFRTDSENWNYAYARSNQIAKSNAKWVTNDYEYIKNEQVLENIEKNVTPKYSKKIGLDYIITSDEKRSNKNTPLYSASMFDISRDHRINLYNYNVNYKDMNVDIYKYNSDTVSSVFYLHNQTEAVVYANIKSKISENYWKLKFMDNSDIDIPREIKEYSHKQTPRSLSIEPTNYEDGNIKEFNLNLYPNVGYQNDVKIVTELNNVDYVTELTGTESTYKLSSNDNGVIVRSNEGDSKIPKRANISIYIGNKNFVDDYKIYDDINASKETDKIKKLYSSYPHPVEYNINKRDDTLELKIDHSYRVSKKVRNQYHVNRKENWVAQYNIDYGDSETTVGYTKQNRRYDLEEFSIVYANNSDVQYISIEPIIVNDRYKIINEQKTRYNIKNLE